MSSEFNLPPMGGNGGDGGSGQPKNALPLRVGTVFRVVFLGSPHFVDVFYYGGRYHLVRPGETPPNRVERRALINVMDVGEGTVYAALLTPAIYERARVLATTHPFSLWAFNFSRYVNEEQKTRYQLDPFRPMLPREKSMVNAATLHDLNAFATRVYGDISTSSQTPHPVPSVKTPRIAAEVAQAILALLSDRPPEALALLYQTFQVTAVEQLSAEQAQTAHEFANALRDEYQSQKPPINNI